MNIFKSIFDKIFSGFKKKNTLNETEKAFERTDAFGDGNAKTTQYNKGIIGRISKGMQPAKKGNRLSSGTSGSIPSLASGRPKEEGGSEDGGMSKDNSTMQEQSPFDSRNNTVQTLPDGSMVDERPQSWENTTRRRRNGVPSDSDLVSRIEYNATNKTLSADTKRGKFNSVEDDGSRFMAFENAGSKGRHAVASGNQSF